MQSAVRQAWLTVLTEESFGMKWALNLIADSASRRKRFSGRKAAGGCLIALDQLEARTLLSAVTVQVPASQDTTLYSGQATQANGAGEFLLTGQAGESDSAKNSLVKFDLGSMGIPDGATIIDAVLTLNLAQSLGPSVAVSVHQLTTAWGEAGSDAVGSEVTGAAAEQFDATWIYAFFDGAVWSSPGGDYESSASASTEVSDPGIYQWFDGGLVADVQQWVDDPSSNHGWAIIGAGVEGSLKSFSSRDSGNALLAPLLEITYEEPIEFGVIEGRIWHDVNADGIRIPPDIMDLGLTFHNGKTYFNSYGANEYWFRSESAEWYFLTADGHLTHWSREPRVLSGELVAELDPRVYYSADLLMADPDAAAEPWLNGFEVELIDSNGSVVATTVTQPLDINGDGAIYPEAEDAWYRFEGIVDGEYSVRHVPPEGWKISGSWHGPQAQEVFDLKEELGLHFWRSLYEDFGGLGERWIRGTSAWYYVVPNGDFYRWNGQPITESAALTGTLVAELGAEYYRDPSLLYAAESPIIKVSAATDELHQRIDFGDYQPVTIKGRKWLDWDGDGAHDPGATGDGGLVAIISGPVDLSDSGSSWFYNEADDEWYIVTDDGQVELWDGTGEPGTGGEPSGGGGPGAPGPTGTGGDDSLAPVDAEPWLNGWTVELLDENGHVVRTTVTGDLDLNDNGTTEIESERGWYLFEDLLPGDYTVRVVEKAGHVQTSAVPTGSSTEAESLFANATFKVGASDYFNWGGLNERWVWSQSGWHYITTDGSLYRWTSGTGGGSGIPIAGTLVAELSASFYVNLDLFVTPNTTSVTASSGSSISDLNVGSHRLIDGAFSQLSDLLLG
jgi:hypothetical protein